MGTGRGAVDCSSPLSHTTDAEVRRRTICPTIDMHPIITLRRDLTRSQEVRVINDGAVVNEGDGVRQCVVEHYDGGTRVGGMSLDDVVDYGHGPQ